ncbi:hypothetical protein GYMLUDRAFT_979881 [Collybiopsis luxurians FD-317 M1]|uniref:Uncharacterized protein n=1 Tax=Collybiopsis luxurians FD-317 M1 TaxID=944289 RepID=A0A0D0ANP2_9AGAR|nr:hypothetical protein GYMLUDRAFT_979881 [Collybiopsis luxurians FD-317 M1]
MPLRSVKKNTGGITRQPNSLMVSAPRRRLPLMSCGSCECPLQPRNALERALLKLPSKYTPDSCFPTDKEIDSINWAFGVPDNWLEAERKAYHEQWNETFRLAGQETINNLGGEPIQLIQIPDSKYSMHFWDGGLEVQGQYCLDFIDHTTSHAVNSPHDWAIYPSSQFVILVPGSCNRIMSWEEAWGFEKGDIPLGEERFSVMQGSWCALECPGTELFWFEVPRMRAPLSVSCAVPSIVPCLQ